MRTNLVVETVPGKAQRVADVIAHMTGMELLLVEGDSRVVAAWSVPDGQSPEPEGISEVLRAMSPEILEVGLVDGHEQG
jgi:hypothetical protein